MLSRAIRNLVENAINYSPPGTTVEIVVEESGMVRVLDEGPGIADDERELIFQRFWRRDRRRAGSAGLGLSIVQRIAEAHAAIVSVENRPMGGADSRCALPASPRLAPDLPDARGSGRAGAPPGAQAVSRAASWAVS